MHRGFVTRFPSLLAALALAAAAVTAHSQQSANPPEPPVEPMVGLAPGDTVDAHFLDFPEAASLRLTVSSAGTLYVPYAGQVKVAGMMPDEAEQAVIEALKTKEVVKSPQVALSVVSARNLSVMVLGAVSLPHQVPLLAPAPLSYVLAQVGPFSNLATYHILIAHRDGSAPTDVELERTGTSMRGMNTTVSPGDIVSVVTAGNFFALGELNHPGIYPVAGTQHMTLLQALTVAGGPTLDAGLSKAKLLRIVDGHREEVIVDLAKLHDGKVADPLIQTDDILFVPRSQIRVVLNSWLNQSLYTLTAVDVVKNF